MGEGVLAQLDRAQRFQHNVSPGLQPPELAPRAAYCVHGWGFSASVNLFLSFTTPPEHCCRTWTDIAFPGRAWPRDKWDKEVAFMSSIPVAAMWRDLEQGQREARGDGPMMLPLSFPVPWQFASQPSKWEHHVSCPGDVWDGNLMEETHMLHLSYATQQHCTEQCSTQAKEAGELWEGL